MSEVAFRVAKEWDVVKVRRTEDGQARRDQLVSEGKCLACAKPLEAGERVTCGQCGTCYAATMRKIRERKISRKEVIREGKMDPPSTGGRKPSNDYTRELSGG